MLGQIGLTATELVSINLDDDIFSRFISLCNNQIDAESITVLKNELKYLRSLLYSLSYTYKYLDSEGTYKGHRELTKISIKLQKTPEGSSEYNSLISQRDSILSTLKDYTSTLRTEQTFAGKCYLLSDIELSVLQYLNENRSRIDKFIELIDQHDIIHGASTAFGKKLYLLVDRNPRSLYYYVANLLATESRNYTKKINKAVIEDIRNSAELLKNRLSNRSTSESILELKSKSSLISRYNIANIDIFHTDNKHLISLADYVQTTNRDSILNFIGRDIFYFTTNKQLLNKLFKTKKDYNLSDFYVAFKNLDTFGVYGLSQHLVSLYCDAVHSLSFRQYNDIRFPESSKEIDYSVGFREVLDTILAFCESVRVPALQEIGGDS